MNGEKKVIYYNNGDKGKIKNCVQNDECRSNFRKVEKYVILKKTEKISKNSEF